MITVVQTSFVEKDAESPGGGTVADDEASPLLVPGDRAVLLLHSAPEEIPRFSHGVATSDPVGGSAFPGFRVRAASGQFLIDRQTGHVGMTQHCQLRDVAGTTPAELMERIRTYVEDD